MIIARIRKTIETSPLGNVSRRIRRALNQKKSGFSGKIKGSKSSNPSKQNKNIFIIISQINIKAKFKALAVVIVAIFFVVINAYAYFSISPVTIGGTEVMNTPKIIDNSELTVMFYVYDQRIDNQQFKNYIEDATLMYLTESTKTYLNIDTAFYVKPIEDIEKTTIHDYLNTHISTSDDLERLNQSVESTIGIRIDRYIAIDKKSWESATANTLSSKDQPDWQNQRLMLLKRFVEGQSNLIAKYYNFLSSYKLTQIFKTNMSRTELIDFYGIITSPDFVKLETLAVDIANFVDEASIEAEVEKGYYFNNILLEEKLQTLFRRIDIIAEQSEVEIYNASNIPGYAQSKSLEFQTLGANVVKYGNYFESSEENLLYLLDEEDLDRYWATISMIRRSLRDELTVKIGNLPVNRTGDIILILGN